MSLLSCCGTSFQLLARRKTVMTHSSKAHPWDRQRQVSATTTPFSLAKKYLSGELLQGIRMPIAKVGRLKRRHPLTVIDRDGVEGVEWQGSVTRQPIIFEIQCSNRDQAWSSMAWRLSSSRPPASHTRIWTQLTFLCYGSRKAYLARSICIFSKEPPKLIDLAENAPSHIPKKSRWEHMIWLSADVSKSRLLPLLILADSPDRIRRWLFHDHPEHDGCSSRQGVPNRFGISILWTRELVFGA